MEKEIKILTTDEFREMLERENDKKGKGAAIDNASEVPSSSKQLTNKERIVALENKVGVLQKENEELKKEMAGVKETLQLVLDIQLNKDNKEEAFIVQPPKTLGPEN